MGERPCLFCGGNDKLSREHIIPQWVRGHLDLADPGASKFVGPASELPSASIFSDDESVLVEVANPDIKIPVSNYVSRCVCAGCNNGWMSQLEAVEGVLGPRIRSRVEPPLLGEDRPLVARWAAKTALLFADQIGRTRGGSGPLLRPFAAKVRAGQLPQSIAVEYLAMSYSSVGAFYAVKKARLHVIGFQIGHVAFRVSLYDPVIVGLRRYRLHVETDLLTPAADVIPVLGQELPGGAKLDEPPNWKWLASTLLTMLEILPESQG